MSKIKVLLLVSLSLGSISCTYIPIPLPPQYVLASEKYVDDTISERVDSLIAGALDEKIDSVIVEVTLIVNNVADSLLRAQEDVFALLEESKVMQKKLYEDIELINNSIQNNENSIITINEDLQYYSTVQDKLYRAVRAVPNISLETIITALSGYRPKPYLDELQAKPNKVEEDVKTAPILETEPDIIPLEKEDEVIPAEETKTDSTITP